MQYMYKPQDIFRSDKKSSVDDQCLKLQSYQIDDLVGNK